MREEVREETPEETRVRRAAERRRRGEMERGRAVQGGGGRGGEGDKEGVPAPLRLPLSAPLGAEAGWAPETGLANAAGPSPHQGGMCVHSLQRRLHFCISSVHRWDVRA
jgi:hypothetical protein